MLDPIEVNYLPDGDDWAVAVKGRGRMLTGKAPGLIAARDRADQLVETLAPEEEHRTVVHLLNGDAVEFTTAYLTARLAKSEPAKPLEAPEPATDGAAADTSADTTADVTDPAANGTATNGTADAAETLEEQPAEAVADAQPAEAEQAAN